jgi:hypothetical protein
MWNFERVNVNRWGSISAPQMIDDRADRVDRVDWPANGLGEGEFGGDFRRIGFGDIRSLGRIP